MRLLASGLITALVALSSATPAVAGDYVHTDGTGDMWRSGVDIEDPYSPDPGQVEGDITRVQMKHNRSHVQLFMTVREAKRETLNSFFYFTLQNGRKQRTEVSVSTYRLFGQPDGALRTTDPRTNRVKRCRGLKGFKINWDTNTVAVTIPRTCVGRPKFLRMLAYDNVNYGDTNYRIMHRATDCRRRGAPGCGAAERSLPSSEHVVTTGAIRPGRHPAAVKRVNLV